MRITGLEISEGAIGGLKAIKADRFGSVVVIAGRNGAGKTRLINYLSGWKDAAQGPGLMTPKDLCNHVWELRQPQLSAQGHSWNSWCADNNWWNKAKHFWSGEVHAKFDRVRPRMVSVKLNGPGEPTIIPFVPNRLSLTDPSGLTKVNVINGAKEAKAALGIGQLFNNSLPFIQRLQDQWYEATHQHSSLPTEDRNAIVHEYEILQMRVKTFLGQELKRSKDGDVTIFGLPIGRANLSAGQCVLLQFCVAIHGQCDRLSELIILMDEPENHLHPDAMLFAINEIRKYLRDGQLWIATHSLPLLANFDPDCIWWMDNGTLEHAGSVPEKVLSGLLGGNENIDKLANFLRLPAAIAINNFTAQCLQPPGVVKTDSDDPQLRQIHSTLKSLRQQGKPLTMVDFGAGRGRFISAFAALDANATQSLDYIAFEPSNEHEQDCQNAIARCYPEATKPRLYCDERALRSALNPQSVDVVLLCNVLHEINPTKWLPQLFGHGGIISHLLKPDGFVLIVEDTEMRIGEKAHDLGFLVLNTGDLRKLFAINNNDATFAYSQERDGRLVATLVPANCLSRANSETLTATLKDVARSAANEIRRLREIKSPSYKDGRKLAFEMQQFANAQLTLQALNV